MSLCYGSGVVDALADAGLGKLDLTVPPYLNINHDTEAKQVELSIQDASKKNQKEMWGMSRPSSPPTGSKGRR